MSAKYIKTKDETIIVFSEFLNHHEFKKFNPISAGFIQFTVDSEGNKLCFCYGESVGLKIESDPEKDSMLAMQNILGYEMFELNDLPEFINHFKK